MEETEFKENRRDPLECYVLKEFMVPKIEPPKDAQPKSNEDYKSEKKGEKLKKRTVVKIARSDQLCNYMVDVPPGVELPKCTFNNCRMQHDLVSYLENKPADLGDNCFVFSSLGYCPRGLSCRFSSMHIDKEGRNLRREGEKSRQEVERQAVNRLDKGVQNELRKKKYDFKDADTACESSWDIINSRTNKGGDSNSANGNSNGEPLEKKPKTEIDDKEQAPEQFEKNGSDCEKNGEPLEKKPKLDVDEENCQKRVSNSNGDINPEDEPPIKKPKVVENKTDNSENSEPPISEDEPPLKKLKTDETSEELEKPLGPVSDEDLVKLRPSEKKKLDWEGKTYLAPLTTVGNLPFRRLCKGLGADITCGEMALGLPLLQGQAAEWALMRKHHSEDFFGVQVCGCSPPQMARVAQLLEQQIDCDFVDINMGCPIDLIYKKGMGSALMARKRPLENIVRTMSAVLSKPLTVKMRTGIYSDKSTAHDIFPLVEEWGASALTLHGRSREQRYTKVADWDYIARCVNTVNIPVFGNGDVMNFEDYNLQRSKSGVAGIMLARGALIKPWVFTEIKEQRHWDISGQERLDMIRDFCNYGLEHWGSDDKGVENTRKFLLEWLSFTHRYVPHGILEYPPQRINERAPLYRGRNELETLLSSPDSRDWVKITEMFLGKVRPEFQFTAKHKANSYS